MDSSATTNGSVVFNGGVGIAKKLNVGSLAINGTDVNLSNIVTTNTAQTITAHKSFTGTTSTGTSTHNIRVGGQDGNCGIKFSSWVGSGVFYELGPEYDTHRMHIRAHNYNVLTVRSDYNSETHNKFIYANGHIELSNPYSIRFIGRGNTALNYYGTTTLFTYFKGNTGGSIDRSLNATITCLRIGHNVTIDIQVDEGNFNSNGTAALITNVAIDSAFRASVNKRVSLVVNNNGNLYAPAFATLDTSGFIIVTPAPSGTFNGKSNNNSMRSFTMTYNIF